MSHMSPFRLNVPNLGADISSGVSNPKKRRKNNGQNNIQTPPNVQDLLPPPLSGYGDTIVASNPFDDCPSSMGMSMVRNPNPMGMGSNMSMAMSNMNMCRPMERTSALDSTTTSSSQIVEDQEQLRVSSMDSTCDFAAPDIGRNPEPMQFQAGVSATPQEENQPRERSTIYENLVELLQGVNDPFHRSCRSVIGRIWARQIVSEDYCTQADKFMREVTATIRKTHPLRNLSDPSTDTIPLVPIIGYPMFQQDLFSLLSPEINPIPAITIELAPVSTATAETEPVEHAQTPIVNELVELASVKNEPVELAPVENDEPLGTSRCDPTIKEQLDGILADLLAERRNEEIQLAAASTVVIQEQPGSSSEMARNHTKFMYDHLIFTLEKKLAQLGDRNDEEAVQLRQKLLESLQGLRNWKGRMDSDKLIDLIKKKLKNK